MPAHPAVPFYGCPAWFPRNPQGIRSSPPACFPIIWTMRKRVLVAASAAVAALALIAGGAYVYLFSGLRTSPAQLGLTATPAATSSPATPAAGLAGRWTVASSSVVGYRVQELFVGQTSKHEAVARTSTVSGGVTVSGDSSGYEVSALTFTAGLAGLHSVDQVAGRNVSQRDGVVSRQLDVQQFPTATFTTGSASVPGALTTGPVDVTVAGKLTIHGVTKDVTAKAKAQVVGDQIEIAGTISIDMTDYQVSPPQLPFTAVDSAVTIEFDVFMMKAA
jgi:polyisoprenoid-binding protein YceI